MKEIPCPQCKITLAIPQLEEDLQCPKCGAFVIDYKQLDQTEFEITKAYPGCNHDGLFVKMVEQFDPNTDKSAVNELGIITCGSKYRCGNEGCDETKEVY